MQRPSLEVADIFHQHGAAWRDSQRAQIPAACAAQRLPSYPPLWLAGQWQPQGMPCAGAPVVGRRPNASRRPTGQRRARRWAVQRSATGLCLQALRPRDGHRATLDERAGHSGATSIMNSPLNHHLSWMSTRLGPSAGLVHARRWKWRSRTHAAPCEGCNTTVAPGPTHTQWHTGAACLPVLVIKPLPKCP